MPRTELSDLYSGQHYKLRKNLFIETQTFSRIMRGSVAQHKSLLFNCNFLWLSNGYIVALFLREENLVKAEHFRNEQFFSQRIK
jgi:hypothetical protein